MFSSHNFKINNNHHSSLNNLQPIQSPWKAGKRQNSFTRLQHIRHLLPSMPHVRLHNIKMGQQAPIRMPRRPLNHIRPIFRPPKRLNTLWIACLLLIQNVQDFLRPQAHLNKTHSIKTIHTMF